MPKLAVPMTRMWLFYVVHVDKQTWELELEQWPGPSRAYPPFLVHHSSLNAFFAMRTLVLFAT